MVNLDYKEKVLEVKKNGGERKIYVTHVTIRQSIFFLALRIIGIEAIASTVLIGFYAIIFTSEFAQRLYGDYIFFYVVFFIFLVFIKSSALIYVIVQWLNEYYEITTNEVIYRRGVIVKFEERCKLEHVGSIELQQGALGEIFNYGTLKLFIWTTEKEMLMYLIHNPKKYQAILDALLPNVEKTKKVFREHILEREPNENKP